MAETNAKKKLTRKTPVKTTDTAVEMNAVEETPVVEETPKATAPKKTAPKQAAPKQEEKKAVYQPNQTDLILCRSVTAGWLGVSGKSGQYYIFENFGDECELEYQDLFALKSRHSNYIYAPHFVIEDEDLLDNPRWADVKKFYDDEVYTLADVEAVLNTPTPGFKAALEKMPRGLAKSLQVYVAEKIEDGSFDSLKKIRIIDEVFGTDFRSILAQ